MTLARFLLVALLVVAASPATPFVQRTLENGLEVIAVQDSTAPVVTICIAVRTGATCQTPETCGLAHFYEHMFFKGNASLPDQTAYNSRMRELGIIQNGMTSDEMVRYFITLPSQRFDEGMEFMYYAIATPLFDEEEIEKERQVVLDEYNRGTTSPFWSYWLSREQVIFPDAPWRASTIGRPEVIASADEGAMRHFLETYYTPDNCALIVAGDVEPEMVFALAATYFTAWSGEGGSDYDELPVITRISSDTTVIVPSPSGTSFVSVAMAGPPFHLDTSSTYAADVWGSYLELMSREFYNDLVTDGPFYNISAGYYTQRCDPVISFSGSVAEGHEMEALAALHAEIDQLSDPGYYDAEGLRLAIEMLRRNRLLSEETAYDVAVESLAFWWVLGGDLDYYSSYLDSLEAVTPEDLSRFIARYLEDRPRASFVLLPEGGAE